jgi:hypothetical protein
MSFYTALQATASRLLASFGQPATIRRPSLQLYDPVTGAVDETPPSTIPTTAVATRVNRDLFTSIEVGDRQLVLDGAVPVRQGDVVLLDGLAWSVVEIMESNPAGTVLAYFARVRR